MNDKIKNIGFLGCGLAIGSVGTYFVLNKSFEMKLNEEVENIKTFYEEKAMDYVRAYVEENVPKVVEENVEKSSEEDSEKTNDNHIDYTTYARPNDSVEPEPEIEEPIPDEPDEEVIEGPRVIPPIELGEKEGYEVISLTYFSDGVIADEVLDPIDVGINVKAHFGEYEPDSVYVINDEYKVYYEILRDLRNYDEALSEGPRKV